MEIVKENNMLQTFTDFLQSIFGTYTPILTYDTNGELVDSSINFGYISAVVIFCIVLFFVLKTIGGLLYEWLR